MRGVDRSAVGRAAAYALVAASVAGCAPMSTRQGAATLAPGQMQVVGGLDAALYRDTEQRMTTPSAQIDVGVRRGLGRDVDAGVRVFVPGIEGGVKWRFARGEWQAAVAPSIAIVRTRDTGLTVPAVHAYSQATVLIGRRLGADTTLNFGPRAQHGLYAPATGGSAWGVTLGGFANVDRALGEGWHVLPEATLVRSIAGDVPVRGFAAQVGAGLALDL